MKKNFRLHPRYKPFDIIGNRCIVYQAILGGMGEVYLCKDKKLNMPIALKTFQKRFLFSVDILESLYQETSIWINLGEHPNIVRCYFFEELDNTPFLFMEWIVCHERRSPNLRYKLTYSSIGLSDALQFAIDICRGLIHAERMCPGIVHGDIRPENILIDINKIAKISDWGLAKAAQSEKEDESEKSFNLLKDIYLGFPFYMAPEIWLGEKPDKRADIYSIGCVIYEMLTGNFVFNPKSIIELRKNHLNSPIPKLSSHKNIPNSVDDIICKCLAKKTIERFESVDELLINLEEVYKNCFLTKPRIIEMNDKRTSEYYIGRAITNTRIKQYREALADANMAIKLDPLNSKVYTCRSDTLLQLNRSEEALKDINHALSLSQDNDAEDLNIRSQIYLDLKKFNKALADNAKAIEISPRNYIFYSNRASIYHFMGILEKTLEFHNRAIALNDRDAVNYNNRASAYRHLDRYEEAVADSKKAIQLAPWLKDAYFNLGYSYHRLQKRKEALSSFNKGLFLDHNSPDALANRAVVLSELERNDEALDDINKAIKLISNNPIYFIFRAIIHKKMNRYQDAIFDYSSAIELGSNDAETYYSRGEIYKKIKKYSDALQDFNTAIKICPDFLEAYNIRWHTNFILEKYEEALSDINHLVEIKFKQNKKTDDNDYFNRGSILASLGKYKEAIEDFSCAISLSPQNDSFYAERGKIHILDGQYDKALIDINFSLKINPENVLANYMYGHLLCERNDYMNALPFLERAAKSGHRNSINILNLAKEQIEYQRMLDKLKEVNSLEDLKVIIKEYPKMMSKKFIDILEITIEQNVPKDLQSEYRRYHSWLLELMSELQ